MALNSFDLRMGNKNRKLFLSLSQVAAILALSVPVIVIESRHLHTPDEKGGGPGGARGGGGTSPKEEDVHEVHPVLRQRLTPKDKCWQTEAYTVVEECDRCTDKEMRESEPVVCVASALKELVECETSKKRTYRSCTRVRWLEERNFWAFEGFLSLAGILSGMAVYVRQKQLDHRTYQRIQRQLASGV